MAVAIDLPAGSSRCACGIAHHVAIEEVALEPGAIERLAAYCGSKGWRRLLLVMDANTREAAGEALAGGLRGAGLDAEEHCFAKRSGLIADQEAVSVVRARLRAGPFDAPVAIGSGVITDIVRYAAHLEDSDFVSVATAASMDGYASGVAAMEFGGVKLTYPARTPLAVFADPAVLAAAPAELTRSGLGDMLGKATARVDWLASHLLYGERFCPEVDARVLGPLNRTLDLAGAVLSGAPAAIESLMQGLVESGIAMAMIGSSRPASGCEHHASHFWDLLAARGLREHAPHGLQVGYATHFAMRLQRFAFAGGVQDLAPPRENASLEAEARDWLGGPAPEVVAAIEEKRRVTADRAARWPAPADWASVRARLTAAQELFPKVERALLAAEIPAEPGFLKLDARTLRATFRYASNLRARYTVIDFLDGQGALEEALDETLGTATSDPGRAGG